jgi:hypothetical protein
MYPIKLLRSDLSTGIREQFVDLGFGGKSDQNLGLERR